MANEEPAKLLRTSVAGWNEWREGSNILFPDLKEEDFSKANLRGANLDGVDLLKSDLSDADLRDTILHSADLRYAKLVGAELGRADLCGALLAQADLRNANLMLADFMFADLSDADLREADLSGTNLNGTHLSGANFEGAELCETICSNVDLTKAIGLAKCFHSGPSIVDHRTLEHSVKVPLKFWRGCGLPDRLIDYLPSLAEDVIQFYSCFMSYSSKDQEFAERLHSDLQSNGVRCWFAPEDMKIGGRLEETIDTAIRLQDKVLLVLSETSIASGWVVKEVKTAVEEEGREGKLVLFPIRIDDAVMNTTDQWAHDIKRTRHIGDFTRWKDDDAYQRTFQRVLTELKKKN